MLYDFYLNKTKTGRFHGFPEDSIPSAAHQQTKGSRVYEGTEWESIFQRTYSCQCDPVPLSTYKRIVAPKLRSKCHQELVSKKRVGLGVKGPWF